MTHPRVEIDIRTSLLSMSEVVSWVEKKSKSDPAREYYIDGDLYAVVSIERTNQGAFR